MREISIKLCPTSWFLFFWSRFCYRNHSKEEVKTEDVTRYESDATPEEIIERVPLRKQEFVLDRLSNTDIAGTQDAVLMVSFVWSYSFFLCVSFVCLTAMTVKQYEVHSRKICVKKNGSLTPDTWFVWLSFSEARSGYRHLQGHDMKGLWWPCPDSVITSVAKHALTLLALYSKQYAIHLAPLNRLTSFNQISQEIPVPGHIIAKFPPSVRLIQEARWRGLR